MAGYLTPISEIRNEINRIFSDMDWMEEPLLPRLARSTKTQWMPPLEMSETDKNVIISVELPGISPNEVNIDIEGNTLVLSGEHQREVKEDEKQFHRSEFHYGSFMRRMTLPDYVNGEEAVAEYQSGVLTINIPKSETMKRKRIEVKKADPYEYQ